MILFLLMQKLMQKGTIATILVALVLMILVISAIYVMIKNKKCGKGCSSCPLSGSCSKKKE